MKELIKITQTKKGTNAVYGRELYKVLGIKTPYKQWFSRMVEYGFIENEDYALVKQKSATKNPKNPTTEIANHLLKIDMAKHIAMIQRSDIGMKVRNYFIKIEKKSRGVEVLTNKLPENLTRVEILTIALESAMKVEELEQKVSEDKPKVDFFDRAMNSDGLMDMSKVANIVKLKDFGRNKIFQLLRDKKILKFDNTPYQAQVDNGRFQVKESVYNVGRGKDRISFTTYVTQKGLEYIIKLVDKDIKGAK